MDIFSFVGELGSTLLTVTLPVFVLLFLVLLLEEKGMLAADRILERHPRLGPLLGALLSAIPGCTGGIVVSRLYLTGGATPATLLAAHLATMGDASFVLWAGRPLTALGLTLAAAFVGTVVGSLLSRYARTALAPPPQCRLDEEEGTLPLWAATVWIVLLAATLLVSRLGKLPLLVTLALFVVATVLSVRLRSPLLLFAKPPWRAAFVQSVADASEITLWVLVGDLIFLLGNALTHERLGHFLAGNSLLVVAASAAVGMIPGCGPQIVVARLYTAGQLPFAALLANTISQHGDALFPLLHTSRRQAGILTLLGAGVGLVAGLLYAAAVHL